MNMKVSPACFEARNPRWFMFFKATRLGRNIRRDVGCGKSLLDTRKPFRNEFIKYIKSYLVNLVLQIEPSRDQPHQDIIFKATELGVFCIHTPKNSR